MYVFIFFIVLGLLTYTTNKKNEVSSSPDFLKWSKKDITIIGSTFAASILLQILDGIFLPKLFVLVYLVFSVLALLFVNKSREQYIANYKKQIEQITDSLTSVLAVKKKDDEPIDYDNLPFEIEKQDDDKVNKIVVMMNKPNKFVDGNLINVVYSLKRYFPYYDWNYECDFPKQQCVFKGQRLPPDVAKWPGSDLRKSWFVPVGVSGDAEVGIKYKSKDFGFSEYRFPDGRRADVCDLPHAPQVLCCGATGGGKAIYINQELW